MTPQELETLIAEKVMGWEVFIVEGKCSDQIQAGDYLDYSPLTDKNQCFDALEAFGAYAMQLAKNHCGDWVTDIQYKSEKPCEYNRHSPHNHVRKRVVHKSLNAAICLALAEAVTGEKQTLEV